MDSTGHFGQGRQLSMLLFRLGALEFELIPEAKTDDEVPEKEGSAGISPAGEGDRCAYPVGCGHQSGTGADIVYACKYVLCKVCATGCRVPLYVRVVDDESGTAEAASAKRAGFCSSRSVSR